MNLFRTLAFTACLSMNLTSLAQVSPTFNPDYNGDGFIGVDDILGALSFYDSPWQGSNDGEWSCGDALSYGGYGYSTVQIGEQCWFAENLRIETYSNGDAISQGLSNVDWSSTEEGALAYYNDNATSEVAFGALYNWRSVVDVRGLCPTGWHVPTDQEWTAMTDALGGESVAGLEMKTAFGWVNDGGGNNLSGFSGFPAGYRATDGLCFNEGYAGYWWSSTPSGAAGWYRGLDLESGTVLRADDSEGPQDSGSIRCIQDAP